MNTDDYIFGLDESSWNIFYDEVELRISKSLIKMRWFLDSYRIKEKVYNLLKKNADELFDKDMDKYIKNESFFEVYIDNLIEKCKDNNRGRKCSIPEAYFNEIFSENFPGFTFLLHEYWFTSNYILKENIFSIIQMKGIDKIDYNLLVNREECASHVYNVLDKLYEDIYNACADKYPEYYTEKYSD